MKTLDAEIWNRLRKGDKSAFDNIYYQYVNVLFNYGCRFTPDRALIEECIQDFFADLWIKRTRLKGTNHIKPYLLLSLKRRLLRQMQKDSKKLKIEDYQDFLIEFSEEDRLINEHMNTQHIEKLNHSLAQLTPKQKESIYLKFYEGLSYAEIADVMEVETKAIYKLVARAIEGLKSGFQIFVLMVIGT